jgi:DMSO/TMAO reductase YedYZ molybdopterin-dependent catalytic subunit
MQRQRGWPDRPFGQKLKKLHHWNAWIVLFLAVSGIALSIGAIRGDLGAVRVWLKQAHVYIGLASIALPALYAPLFLRHWRQLRKRPKQRANLLAVLLLVTGWLLSGAVLWQLRHVPPGWASAALFVHDLFSWVGIPYAVCHSVIRGFRLREEKRRERPSPVAEEEGGRQPPRFPRLQEMLRVWRDNPPIPRRTFLKGAAALVLLALFGPKLLRWLGEAGSLPPGGEYGEDGNAMRPLPSPLPESSPPAGGGRQGRFRIYTVTDFPVFTAENWKFTIGGLVDRPQEWTWTQFLELKRKVQVSDFHCVTGWSVNRITWEGLPVSALLELAGVQSAARYVKFVSGDGVYTDALSLEQARMEDVMAAVLIDGQLIPQPLGGPVRLVVPRMYAYKSVKWLTGMILVDQPHIGYWEERGYDNDAWVKR